MEWTNIMRFLRGPLFHVSLLIFVGGLAYRLVRVLLLGWSRDRVESRGSKTVGVIKAYVKGILILPFIPWVKRTFSPNVLTYVAGGLFHLALFAVIIFGTPHMLVWKSLLGGGWPTAPSPLIDWLAALGILSLLLLLLNRIVHPVLRLITGVQIWLNWVFVFLPMATGTMLTHHLLFRYEVLFSLHMLAVDVMLIWIPLSQIPHFLFYFFSKTIHGAQAGKRAVMP